MATIKSFTSLEQSKVLAEILPLESADMYFTGRQSITNPKEWEYGDTPKVRGKYIAFDNKRIFYPCWSLAALLKQLKAEIQLENKQILFLHINKYNDINYDIRYTNSWTGEVLIAETDNLVDACVAMIEKLHELNLL